MQSITKLAEIVGRAPVLLNDIRDEDAAKPGSQGKWSKKQELGHLVDSASNNHQRIVRAQLETEPSLPDYDGDRWVMLHNYQAMEWKELIERWHSEPTPARGGQRNLAASCGTQAHGRRRQPDHTGLSGHRLCPPSFTSSTPHRR